MENSQPRPTAHSDQRHNVIAGRLRDALFSAVASKYVTNDHSLHFAAEQLKSEIQRRLQEYLPSLRTPTHLPYASMIHRALVELGQEDGSSEESISDFIKKEYEDLPWAHAAFLRQHLGKLCESGELMKSKCGRYKFKIEDNRVRRRKRRGKTPGRSQPRRVETRDGVEDSDGKMQSLNPMIVTGLPADGALKIKGPEEQSGSLGEEIDVAEVAQTQGQMEVLDKLEVRVDDMIDEHREEEEPKETNNHRVITPLQTDNHNGVRRKKRQGKTVGKSRPRRVESRDGVEEFDGKTQLQNPMIVLGLPAEGALKIKGSEKQTGWLGEEIDVAEGDQTQGGQMEVPDELEVREDDLIDEHREEEVHSGVGVEDFDGTKQSWNEEKAQTVGGAEEQSGSLREEIDVAEEGEHALGVRMEVSDKLEVREDDMIGEHREEEEQVEMMEGPEEIVREGSNGEEEPSEETTLDFSKTKSNRGNGKENEFNAQCFKKLEEENELLEFFDTKLDKDDEQTNEAVDAQSLEVLIGVSDEQNKLQEQETMSDEQSLSGKVDNPQLSQERRNNMSSPETPITLDTSIVRSPPLRYQYEMPKQRTSISETDIMCGPNSEPLKRHSRGRPQKLNVQGTSTVPFSSSIQGCNQHHAELDDGEKLASRPETGEAKDPQLSQERRKDMSSPETTITLDTRIVRSPPLRHQFEMSKHRTSISETDIICGLESEPPKRRSRGRPRKLNVQETSTVPCHSSIQGNQHHAEVVDEEKEASRPETGEAEDPDISQERPKIIWSPGFTLTLDTSKAISPPIDPQFEMLKHAEEGRTSVSGTDIMYCHKGRGRGWLRKLNVHATLADPFPPSVQGCNQPHPELDDPDKEASRPETGEGTHHIDQQQHRSSEKRGRGRPPKQKIYADLLLKDMLNSEKPKRRGRGRSHWPPNSLNREKDSF